MVPILLLGLSFFVRCSSEETISVEDAQSQVFSAVQYVSKKCGDPAPSPPLIVFDEVYKRNLDLCTIAITRTECPFLGYPISCVLMYLDKEASNIPWYVNYEELNKIKFP
ncbi:hypothetical protein EHQ64_11610 [Leptospira sarikeiensis]|uniref:TIGR04452 family lipoprotein n=1 Tax=Leptospira sarikeiensis TaxID=2484943 RepID=A0A4R9K8S2_9LEPT|nr:hypothetical protein [Leptospira sarikeiensis]TGL61095.1 hypothetical protein EHQ64_11610 [Leptospira sarikeiensis]